MIPSTVTAQAAHERHAEFRRVAAAGVPRIATTGSSSGEAAGAFARRVRTLPILRQMVAGPRPA